MIGMAGRGHDEKIVFDFDDPMGALDLRRLRRMRAGLPDRRADAGDAGRRRQRAHANIPTARSTASAPIAASAASSPTTSRTTSSSTSTAATARPTRTGSASRAASASTTCTNPQRLTKPMIRKDGVAKDADDLIDPSNPWTHFREATWEEALDRAAAGLEENPRPRRRRRRSPASARPRARTKRPICSRSWSAPASAPTTSTTARGSATPRRWRRCWRASARRAVTATFNECKNSDVIIVIGANPTENHPVAATFFKQAAKRGAKLIVMDPRGQALKRHAWHMLQFKNGTDVAMLNAHAQRHRRREALRPAIRPDLHRGLRAARRAASRTSRRRRWRRSAASTPDTLRDVARTFARAESADHLLGHGRLAAHPRHRQRALPDRAVADHRPDRPARHRAASAARPEQRAGRLRRRPDPDVLPRLQVGRGRRDPRQVRDGLGRRRSIPSAA